MKVCPSVRDKICPKIYEHEFDPPPLLKKISKKLRIWFAMAPLTLKVMLLRKHESDNEKDEDEDGCLLKKD